MSELKIGPRLTVHLQEGEVFVPTMQQAYETDGEAGAHWLNNAKSEEFSKQWPTVMAMAALIEKERDELKEQLRIERITEKCINCGHSFSPSWVESGWCILCILKERDHRILQLEADLAAANKQLETTLKKQE